MSAPPMATACPSSSRAAWDRMLAGSVTHRPAGEDSRVPGHRPSRLRRSRRPGRAVARRAASVPLRVRRMRLVPTLYAERLEGYIRYRLEVPERAVGLPLQEEFTHALD